jgi:HTH-type transcriptional regulator/antitoxin PezA
LNERIKKLRKALDLTQQEFADRIGVKRNTIATYEIGRNTPLDAVITSICKTYNVSETWLRTGEGEMFVQQSADDELAQVFAAIAASDDELIKRIIRAYWLLDDREKAAVKKLIDGFTLDGSAVPAFAPAPVDRRTLAEKPAAEWTDAEINTEAEEYRRELLEEKKQAVSGSASAASGETKLA